MPKQLQEQWRDILLELLLSIGHELSLEAQFKQFLPVLLRKLACKAVAVFEIDPIFYQDYVLVKELPRHSGLSQFAASLTDYNQASGELIATLDSGKVYAYTLSGYGILCIKHNDLPTIFQYELRQLCEHFSYRLRACLQHQKLQQSQQELDRFFALSDNLMCIMDAKGYFIKVNPAFLEKLLFTLDDVYSTPLTAFIHPDDLHDTENLFKQLLNEQSLTLKNRFRQASGYYLDLAWDFARDPVTGNIYATAMDISQQVAIAEKLLQAKETAEQTAAAKAAFLANMSHEIRTPLNGVIGMLDIVLQQPMAPDIKQQIQTAMSSGKNLLAIVNDVLDFSKISAGKLNLELIDFNLNVLMQEIVESFQYLAKQKQLSLNYESNIKEALWLKGDPLRIKQIVTNLMGNALKFTKQGGVTLKVNIQQNNLSNLLLLQVIDSGIGLDTRQQAHLFQAFSQADVSTTRHYGGTGLGLAICQELVALMAGDISVVSTLGEGSTFTVKLQLATGNPQQVIKSTAASSQQNCFNNLKILLVEDNEVNRKIATTYLRQWGCQVILAENGIEAIAKLKQSSSHDISLVLMDCLMPKMDGYKATQLIRQGAAGLCWQAVPIIALTANAMLEDRQRCLASGMDDYLAKPFNQAALKTAIIRLLQLTPDRETAKSLTELTVLEPSTSDSHRQEPIEEAALGELWQPAICYKNFPDMEALANELISLFTEQLPLTIAQLQQAWSEQDFTSLRLLSHSLKSSALQLGLVVLSAAAKELEMALREAKTENISDLYTHLVCVAEQSLVFLLNK
ncbi:ATP-binding protein [Alishewanella sp. d11]|uniref:hybrid sensor histidine kinase/response regulator n=1 Tax=Alishewanella sp. d11 TaxID=3414030 RepID=UPI003BF815F8